MPVADPRERAVDYIEPPIEPYQPDEDEEVTLRECEERFDRWSEDRRPHEGQWFVNAAYYRGRPLPSGVFTGDRANQLRPLTELLATQRLRKRVTINRLQAKIRARLAKFLRNRPLPVVAPATAEIKDKLNARATTKALTYAWRKFRLEDKYHEACLWSSIAGRGYWWFHWDPTAMVRVAVPPGAQLMLPPTEEEEALEAPDPIEKEGDDFMEGMEAPEPMSPPSPPQQGGTEPGTGTTVIDVPLGDIRIEVGSPFEVLIADPGVERIADQPEIMRITVRAVKEIRARYPERGAYVEPTTTEDEALHFERRIANLTAAGMATGPALISRSGGTMDERQRGTHVLVKEWFMRPTAEYPRGRYVVVANGVLLKDEDELPYGFHLTPNPYPVVDFPDLLTPGQYWNTTVLEQLIGPQTLYDNLRSKIEAYLQLMIFPKLLVAKQHRLPAGSWTDDAGEMIEYWAHPGIPDPKPWTPPPIAADAWRTIDLIREEMDTVAHIFPEAEGRVGEASSGFQTNLLQEATDAIHAPDIKVHERALEDAAYKIRALMKYGYTVPRLITVAGRDMEAEVFEFSADQIDEYADIRVETGSILPDLKGARIQAILEMWNAGIFGPPQDPESRRQVQTMLEFGQRDDLYDFARRDEEKARRENQAFAEEKAVAPPLAFDNHQLHMRFHTDDMKSAESERWAPPAWGARLEHVILHARFMNPATAIDLATIYNRLDLVQDLLQPPPGMMPGPPGAPMPAGPRGPQGPPAASPPVPGPPGNSAGATNAAPSPVAPRPGGAPATPR